MDKNTNEKYFRTTSFYTACFLFSKGHELVNVDRLQDPKKADFVFINSSDLQLSVHEFNFSKDDSPTLLINVRAFITAIKQIKNALYEGVDV